MQKQSHGGQWSLLDVKFFEWWYWIIEFWTWIHREKVQNGGLQENLKHNSDSCWALVQSVALILKYVIAWRFTWSFLLSARLGAIALLCCQCCCIIIAAFFVCWETQLSSKPPPPPAPLDWRCSPRCPVWRGLVWPIRARHCHRVTNQRPAEPGVQQTADTRNRFWQRSVAWDWSQCCGLEFLMTISCHDEVSWQVTISALMSESISCLVLLTLIPWPPIILLTLEAC